MIYSGDHLKIYRNIESVYCITETNIALWSIILQKPRKKIVNNVNTSKESNMIKMNLSTKQKLAHRENRLVVLRRIGGRGRDQVGAGD